MRALDRSLLVRALRIEAKEFDVSRQAPSRNVRDLGQSKRTQRSRQRTARTAALITYFSMQRSGATNRHRANIRGRRRAIDFVSRSSDSLINRALRDTW